MKWGLFNQQVVTIYGVPHYDERKKQTSTIQDEGLYGMPAQILEYINGTWAKIRTHYRYEGYVPLKALEFLDDNKWADWQKSQSARRVILPSFVDVLACPKVQGICLQTLTRGALVTFIRSHDDGWSTIKLNDETEGYVKTHALGTYRTRTEVEDEEILRKRIVQTALSYLGTPYRWGGKSPLGIDCSGLVSMAYLLNGIVIYRDAKMKEGFPIHPIDASQKKPADLFYYPGHIAMYIGNDEYIHATARNGSDGVVINSLNPNAPHYRADLPSMMYAVGSFFK